MWRRIMACIVGLLLIGVCTFLWLKNPDSHVMPIVFGVVGAVIAILAWVFPLSSVVSKPSQPLHKKWAARLTAVADANKKGQEIYLLPSEHWRDLMRERHSELQIKHVGEIMVGRRRCFGVVFRDLAPNEYLIWTKGVEPIAVDLDKGQIMQISLPQPRLGSVQ